MHRAGQIVVVENQRCLLLSCSLLRLLNLQGDLWVSPGKPLVKRRCHLATQKQLVHLNVL